MVSVRSLCSVLLIVGLAAAYPLEDPAPAEDVHEPVSPAEVAAQLDKEAAGQPALQETPVSDDVHEPVYANPEGDASSESVEEVVRPQEDSREALSGPESSFSRYDEDGDGYIDIFEWERKIEDELAKKKFKDADADANEKVSQEEYNQWLSPVDPQENVNEVYVPVLLPAQPVDEAAALPPVGRSAQEENPGADQPKEIIVDPLVSDPALAPLPLESQPEAVLPPQAIPLDEKVLLVPSENAGQEVAIPEEAEQPAVVLLDDKKPEVPAVSEIKEPEVAPIKPALKSISDAEVPVVQPQEEVKKEELPVKEESVAVESQEKPGEDVKVEVPAVKSEVEASIPLADASKPEVAKEVKPEVAEEVKLEAAAEEVKKQEVPVEEKKEEQKLPEVASEAAPLPASSEEPAKAELNEEAKASNDIKPSAS